MKRQLLSLSLCAVVAAITSLLLLECIRPDALLVGNVTVDIVDGNHTVGGAITNAAAVLEAQGKRGCIVTTAGPEAELSIFSNHDLHIVHDNATLTFAHSYTWWGHKRVLHVPRKPSVTLEWKHVPFICRLAKTVFIMPLLPSDVDAPPFLKWRNFQNRFLPQKIALAAQGFQRDLAADGKVVPLDAPHPLFLESLGEGVTVFLSDVESDPWSEEDLQKVVTSSDRLIITKGDKGCEEFIKDTKRTVNAVKVDKVIDTNGAGDTFATAYMLAFNAQSPDPAMDASMAAARIVIKPQKCKPWCIVTDEIVSNFITAKGRVDWLSSTMDRLNGRNLEWLFQSWMFKKAKEH